MMRGSFTGHNAVALGSAPYTQGPQRNPSTMFAPAIRQASAPMLARPAPGPWSFSKTANDPAINPSNWLPEPPTSSNT